MTTRTPDPDGTYGVDRRTFIHGAITLVCVPPGLAAACTGRTLQEPRSDSGLDEAPQDGTSDAPGDSSGIDGWPVPGGTTLSPARYATLSALMDALIPGDARAAGAAEAHAAWYLDQLLGAFRVDPPRIYAGGPYSGRHGGHASFAQFQRLTRVESLRWRTYLEGSRGLPEREWNGPVAGLVEQYETGLDAIEAATQRAAQRRFTAASRATRRSILQSADTAFVQMAYVHAVEGTYGDPVYGGNFESRGWTAIGYEGDRQPVGYTARQMSNPEEG